jgi:hypothetical protein
MRKIIALACMALPALAMHGNLSAQQGPRSSGEYYRDLGVIFGVIEAVRDIADICSEEFPETEENNEKDYQLWRTRHLDLLEEVERHRTKILENPVLGARYKLDVHSRNLTFKTNQRRALAADGAAAFRANCNKYGDMTSFPQWDLETSFAGHIATMRRGPAP